MEKILSYNRTENGFQGRLQHSILKKLAEITAEKKKEKRKEKAEWLRKKFR